MTRILVTGGAGFIGSHLVRALVADGCEVIVADNFSTGRRQNLVPGVDVVEIDLGTDSFARMPTAPFDAIMHLAGQSSGERSFIDPPNDLDANGKSTVRLAEWAGEGVLFLHASSMGVYGQPSTELVCEDAPCQPLSYYGASKLYAERALSVAAKRGLRSVSFRMFNVYGPGQNLNDLQQGMVSIYLAQLLKKGPLVVKGALKRVRDFIYIDDVVEAWKRALVTPAAGPLNLGTGRGTSVRELITGLLMALNLDPAYPIEELPPTPGDQTALTADICAIRRALNWEPRVNLETGLNRMVRWAAGEAGA